MKEFDLGQPVLYCLGYGESTKNMYRWGSVEAGFIISKEYIEARNLYLYTIGTIKDKRPHYKKLGAHYIFNIDEYESAEVMMKGLCEVYDD